MAGCGCMSDLKMNNHYTVKTDGLFQPLLVFFELQKLRLK